MKKPFFLISCDRSHQNAAGRTQGSRKLDGHRSSASCAGRALTRGRGFLPSTHKPTQAGGVPWPFLFISRMLHSLQFAGECIHGGQRLWRNHSGFAPRHRPCFARNRDPSHAPRPRACVEWSIQWSLGPPSEPRTTSNQAISAQDIRVPQPSCFPLHTNLHARVCMYALCECLYACLRTCLCACLYACLCAHAYMSMRMHMHMSMHMHVCMSPHTAPLHAHISLHMSTRLCLHTSPSPHPRATGGISAKTSARVYMHT